MVITFRLCVLGTNRLLSYTILTVWFLQPTCRVFRARYGLSPYITQIRFVFKGLNYFIYYIILYYIILYYIILYYKTVIVI